MLITADPTRMGVSENRSAELIGRWLDAVGLDANALPCDTEDAAMILSDGGQYDIDADELTDLGQRGQVPRIEQWHAADLLAAACALEGRRQWKASPSFHDPKKSETRRALEACLAAGPEGLEILRSQMAKFDMRLVLCLLAEADNRQIREQLVTTVEALLVLRENQ